MTKTLTKPAAKNYSSVSSFLSDYRRYLARQNPKNFTQVAVTKSLKFGTPQYLCNIESGRHEPPVDVAVKLAEYYGIKNSIIYDLFMKVYSLELQKKMKKASS